MPACKDITDPDGVGSGKVRCGLVDISAAGLKFQVGIGGVADADFMEYEQIAAENLPVSQKVHLKWEDAVFYGRHWLLGPVIAHLDMERHPAVTQRSFVLSVAENSAGYFPAFNENHFIFNFFLPRFNLRFKSDEEIINSATIFSIPPVNSIYELKNMVTYKVDRGNSGFWKFIIPKFKIEKCNIKLLEIKNIQLTYNVISETDNDVSFDFTAVNNTSEPEIEVTWMVWNRFQIDVDDLIGSIRMKKTPVKFSVVIPKKILNTDRWIALSLSQPFRTDAAQSLRLPVYQS